MQPSLSFVFILLGCLLLGSAHSTNGADWEELYLASLSADSVRAFAQNYTATAHLAGTEEDYQSALYTQDQLRAFGADEVELTAINVTLTYPGQRQVEIVEGERFVASLKEDPVPEDPSSNRSDIVPTFVGYSPSGNVTAETVYANFGRVEDFAELERANVSVKGRVVVVRYGMIFRGTKVLLAQQRGAVGVLIYSDPQQDGFVMGPVYPEGPWRPASGVQRGSVQFLSICPGDPSAARRDRCLNEKTPANSTTPSIPVMPLSWADALPILMSMGGPAVPPNNTDWVGGFNSSVYHLGPGRKLMLATEIFVKVTPIWNVCARFNGSELPDEYVVLGNHRDAWVFGAADPSSGSAALLEMAKGFHALRQAGWKNRRTIIMCSWDAEEYGLVGSTWYGETFADELSKKAVAYLNVDVAVAGQDFQAGATPSLRSLVRDVAGVVSDPASNTSIASRWDGYISTLGSGSDYTVFLDRLGIPSTDMSFRGSYGVYHSIYDSFHWMTSFGDPTYQFHKASAQMWGLMAMRLADPAVLPFNYTDYGVALSGYAQQMKDMLTAQGATGKLDLRPLLDAIADFKDDAKDLADEHSSLMKKYSGNATTNDELAAYNKRIRTAERSWLDPKGLADQGRPYFRHVIQAPALYNGYGSDPFPGLAQAIRDGQWSVAEKQIDVIVARMKAVRNVLLDKQNAENETVVIVLAAVWGAICALALLVLVLYFVYRVVKNRRGGYETLGNEA
jgi:N-acetylated-alpha-linked acidic dipeptidase